MAVVGFCFPFFFPSPCCFRFSAPSLYCSSVSVIATVVAHGAGGDDGGCRWWFQAAASPPFSSVSTFPLSVSVFASSSLSHGAGAVNNDGEDGSSWQWL